MIKTWITALSVLTLATGSGGFGSAFNTNMITNNQQKTQQNTIYINKYGKEISTNRKDLSALNVTEVIQIGFYQNWEGEIEVVKMPKTIKKVPTQLPAEITSLCNMFAGCTEFNQDISNWDTSNVTNMDGMFYGATAFNQGIVNWNTANVKTMWGMFFCATSFNRSIASWNVSNVEDIAGMFFGATSFNQDIGKWNVSKVSYIGYMFYGATAFNQDISSWDTSNVVYMSGMFCGATAFNQDLSKWNVDKVTQHKSFSVNSGIDSAKKLPHFKK